MPNIKKWIQQAASRVARYTGSRDSFSKTSIMLNNRIKKTSIKDALHITYLTSNGWKINDDDTVVSKHGGVKIEGDNSINAAAAFQDFIHRFTRTIEQENLTELIMIRAKDPKTWEAALWEKFSDQCVELAKYELTESLLDE